MQQARTVALRHISSTADEDLLARHARRLELPS
jgi:hypothetical protein